MKTMQFKTNIKCGGCIEKATPYLDKAVGKANWEVDTIRPDKVLTVKAEDVSVDQVRQAVEAAGFRAEPLN